MSKQQTNFGIGNTNESKTYNVFLSTLPDDLVNLLQQVSAKIEEEDKKINALLHGQVLINKTGQHEVYSTEKIIRSLLNLGIPLLTSYEIAQATVSKIYSHLKSSENIGKYLSTKDIRKMVSKSIQEVDPQKYSIFEIETWTNKYARRYGHNNRCIEIYWHDSDEVCEVSYEFISNRLLPDVIDTIAKGAELSSEISTKQRKDMATEVLSFINQCDLYRIRYNLLKDMIIEIATQPPHPWMINDDIRESILEYDFDALCENIEIIRPAVENRRPVPQSAELEILHHASALILGMHNYFFGCFDLSAFFQLNGILSSLLNNDYWNDAIQRSKLSQLLSDISFAGVEVANLSSLISSLASDVKARKINTQKFADNIIKFADLAKRIYLLGNYEDVETILRSDWRIQPASEVLPAIKTLLYSVFPPRIYNLNYTNNYFWLNYATIKLPSFETTDFKNQVFVIYTTNANIDISFLSVLKNVKAKKTCNTIFLVAENADILATLERRINDDSTFKSIGEYYQIVTFTQEQVVSLFESNDKILWLDKHLLEQMLLG